MTDLIKARRELLRWELIRTLNNARPLGALDVLLLSVMQAIFSDCTAKELHTELEYLEDRKLVEVDKKPDGHWHSKLTHYGVDVAEYTVNCFAGIARPPNYWNG